MFKNIHMLYNTKKGAVQSVSTCYELLFYFDVFLWQELFAEVDSV